MVTLSPELSRRIEGVLTGQGCLDSSMDEEAALRGMLALYGSIGVIVGIKPDGSFWKFDPEENAPLLQLEPELETQCLVLGSKRYAWLAEALPVRPASSWQCSLCNGLGFLGETSKLGVYAASPSIEEKSVVCLKCLGLGWLQI